MRGARTITLHDARCALSAAHRVPRAWVTIRARPHASTVAVVAIIAVVTTAPARRRRYRWNCPGVGLANVASTTLRREHARWSTEVL